MVSNSCFRKWFQRMVSKMLSTSNLCKCSKHNGLNQWSLVKPFTTLCEKLQKYLTVAMRNYNVDGASANDRMLAYAYSKLLLSTLISHKRCGLHLNKHIEAGTSNSADASTVSAVFNLAVTLRMGTYFVRLSLAVEKFLEKDGVLLMRRDKPSAAATAYAQQIFQYMLSTAGISDLSRNLDEGNGRRKGSTGNQAHAQLRKLWEELCSVLNGEWWHLFGHLVHHCVDWNCCKGYNPVVCRAKIKAIILKCILRCKPQVPASIRWTKLGMSLDFNVGFLAPHNLGRYLFEIAFDKLAATVEKKALSWRPSGVCADYANDINWNAVTHARLRHSFGYLSSSPVQSRVLMLAVTIEPLRFVTRWLLSKSKEAKDYLKHPPMMDLVTPRFSPITVARQCISSLLSGRSDRLQVIFRRYGCATLSDFVLAHPDEAICLRRILLTEECMTYQKQTHQYKQWPWILIAVADTRVSLAERLEVDTLLLKVAPALVQQFSFSIADFWKASFIWIGKPFELRL